MVDDLMRSFSVGGAVLGNLSAIYLYVYAGIQIPVGVVLDRFGVQRTASVAAFFCAGGALVFAMAGDLSMAYLGRAMIGLGAAFSFAGAMAVAGHWFPMRFAVLTGVSQAFGVAGGIAGQAPLSLSIDMVGWRASMIYVAAAGAILAIFIYLTVRDRGRVVSGDPEHSMFSGLVFAAKSARTWIAAGIGGSMTAVMLSFAGLWGVPYLIAMRGIDKPAAAAIMSVLFLGWAIGAPALGWISDKVGRRKPVIIAGTVMATGLILAVVMFPTAPVWLLSIFLFFQGMGASCMVLCFAVAREHNPIWASGATIGVVNTFVVGSGAIMQPVMGLVLDYNWDGAMLNGARVYSADAYAAAMPLLPAVSAIGLLLALCISETSGSKRQST